MEPPSSRKQKLPSDLPLKRLQRKLGQRRNDSGNLR